ncbi:MAG TPA: HEAT repeat domain-containing protein [Lacipirellulaceae bacterium]|jgi:putative heme-binding domain-containing protein|nr:HEAT repeat domain-containing protein [Lacipirellulaceae bacterium]
MRLVPVRLAIVLSCCLAFLHIFSGDAAAQRQQQPRGRTSQVPTQRQPAAGRPAASNTQNRPANSSTQTPTKPPVLENADPETRAAFLKLIGANWIWSPAHSKDEVPVGDCYFRKTFPAQNAELAQVHIACDNQYELYVNGRLAGSGNDWRKMDVHDITKLLNPGRNVIAIKVTNTDPGAAGLVARVIVKEKGGTFESFSSDESWRTSVKQFGNWMQPNVRDSEWLAAKVYGPLGGVLPWGDEIVIADEGSRFLVDSEFAIERLIADEQAGSLISMAFTASGDILASQENGPLLLIRDIDKDGTLETVKPFCTELKNVHGILPLGKRVYAVGDGPDRGGLYQISDDDGDGRSDNVTTLLRFHGSLGEHGPHTVRLGPDGLLYVLSGNHAQADVKFDPRSNYGAVYEGELIKPRYEDPNGHAVGILAPGGTILRTNMSGSFVEIVAGGFRNPYDFAFNGDGELFTYDADMEWDIGAPWYRPTRVNHVPPGAELGWRSGWTKWPEYYIDSLPATLNIGPGSPTGVVFYDHVMFPVRLQNTLFIGDWATGQIHAVKLQRNGATYTAKYSTFVKGRPLNVTGLDVGPDGALYFSTGGRGTDGGIYRVRWTGTVPPQAIQFGQGIDQALHQPQLHSDWARMRVAAVKRSLGDRWQSDLHRVLADPASQPKLRLRAIELLTFFGPPPSPELLVRLARDADPAMRVRAARLMGAQTQPGFSQPLARMLGDSDAWVRRVACETIAHRLGASPSAGDVPTDALIRLLSDPDRFVSFSARRALEKTPAEAWKGKVLAAADPNTFLQGATGLLVAYPSAETARQILARCEAMMRGQVTEPGRRAGEMSDPLFLDLLRVVQLSLIRGELQPADVTSMAQQLLREYPTRDAMLNRELVRLLAYLQPSGATGAFAKQLQSDIPDVEKLHIAGYAARMTNGWQTEDKLALLRYYEQARGLEGGHSLSGYIENFARDFFTNLTLEERRQVLAAGESYPTSALSVLAKLPENPGADVLAEIRALDQRLEGVPGEPIARLRVGIVAVLGRSGEEQSLAYLRDVYLRNPQRRAPVAMSLTQHPDGENWPILVDSLRTVEGEAAQEVLTALTKVSRRPETSEPYRNAILLGLRMQNGGGELAAKLLQHWWPETPHRSGASLQAQLAAWQKWYAKTFPNELPAELPKEAQPNKWSYEELASYLESAEGRAGSPSRGAQAFHDAQCIKCHRFNGRGEGIGPDLTTVAHRFQRKEILESIVYPGQVVSDQYASQIIIANGKTYTGIAAKNANGDMTVLQSDGTKVQVAADDIEKVQASKASSMPEGLLNTLTLEQVADLFAFMMNAPEPGVAARGPGAAR